ncbi:MAG: hypothetical protein IKU72_03550 [Oscillospiraceae bacterium]|nr:hypothetical protein [Oscillospiraceae bacterium]
MCVEKKMKESIRTPNESKDNQDCFDQTSPKSNDDHILGSPDDISEYSGSYISEKDRTYQDEVIDMMYEIYMLYFADEDERMAEKYSGKSFEDGVGK